MSRVHEIVGMALAMNSTMELNQNQWKDEILEEWEKSKNYPRKKKKKVRRSLELDWAFASWSPLDDIGRW